MSFAQDPDFGTLHPIAYALRRRRRVLKRLVKGGPEAPKAADSLAQAVVDHFALCGWDFYGTNSDEAIIDALAGAILAANPSDLADMTSSHPSDADSSMRVAKALLLALRAKGGNVARLKAEDPWPTTPRNIHKSVDRDRSKDV